jgi:YD repeat-containing protein
MVLAGKSPAQTITYHLLEPTSGSYLLETTGPTPPIQTLTTSLPTCSGCGVNAPQFQGQTYHPYDIASGATITVGLWLAKTASGGTIQPWAKLWYYNSQGSEFPFCEGTGSASITTTLTFYQFTCTTNQSVPANSLLVLWAGVYITTSPGRKPGSFELGIEGTLNGSDDSRTTIPVPAPQIQSVSPTSGLAGSSVTINGSYFGVHQGTSTITFNGVAATATAWGDGTITANVPGSAATGPVVVTVNGTASNGVSFSVVPNITSLSTTSGPVGLSVTITGSGFANTQGTSTVAFSGIASTPTSWSPTAIAVPVPSGATSGPVTVTVGGVASNSINFSVTPGITSITPATGSTGTSVTINGSSFGSSQGTSTVTFNGLSANPTSWSAASIVVPVPASATTGPVVVTVGGVSSNSYTFTTIPTISSISPTSAGANAYLTLTGTAFGSAIGSSTVTFNGTSANPNSWSNTKIVVPVPSNATNGPVVVTVGGQASNGATFTLSNSHAIAGIVSRASDGSALSGVIVEALQSGTVKASVATGADGSYTFSALTAGSYDVSAFLSGYFAATRTGTLVPANGTVTVNFSLVAPTIIGLSPSSGAVGTVVTITGSHFGTSQGSSSLTFGGVTATPTNWSDTTIVAPVPPGAATGPVVATVSAAASNAVTFNIGTGTIAGTVTQSGSGTPIASALIEALQSNVVKTSTNSASDGTYSLTNVAPGVYDLRFSASGFGTSIQPGNTLSSGTITVNGVLGSPGTISGHITQSDGVTPIQGAAVVALQGTDSAGNTTTSTNGSYSLSTLAPGSYQVQASASGFTAQSVGGVSVTAGNTTTENISLAGQSTITYQYDDVGRLIGVVDSLQGAAGYSYDAVGNLLSITRFSSSQVAITGFTPTSGIAGTAVTINGTGFSTTASQDGVTFNGTQATIVSASTTQIVATVPAGATSGPIAVTAPGGSATSSNSFSVTAAGSLPSISGFSPAIVAAGGALAISGTGFDTSSQNDLTKINTVSVNVSAASNTSISVAAPPFSTSGKISVSTPLGIAVSSTDLYVAPPPLQPSNVGFTQRLPFGGSTTVTVGTNQVALVLFDATAGQQMSLATTLTTLSDWLNVSIVSPSGLTLSSSTFTNITGFVDKTILPVTGTYTILLQPYSWRAGSFNINLYNIPADVTGTITANGAPNVVPIGTPGQNALLTFSVSSEQHLSLYIFNKTNLGWTDFYIYGPDKSTLGSQTITSSSGFFDTMDLKLPGIYSIRMDPEGSTTGSATLALFTVPADVTGTVTINGPVTNVAIGTPGQNGDITFSGTAGQLATVNMSNNTMCVTVSLLPPGGGSSLSSFDECGGTPPAYLPQVTLPSTGTYTIFVNPDGPSFGSVSTGVTSP